MKLPNINERVFLVLLTIANLAVRFFRIDDPNFAYFDEKAFYIPAAKELLQTGIDPLFEHPPLSKILFASSIWVFGDNPLGWRFFPITFSVISVVVVYFLAKKLFQDRSVASLAAILFSLDFGWFTSSRVAFPETIFASLFLIGGYFLVCFLKDERWKKQRVNLVLAAVFFGLALATKWTALLGLPVWLAIIFYKKRKELRELAASLIILLAISVGSYLVVYAPFLKNFSITDFIGSQRRMVDYHTREVSSIVASNQKLLAQSQTYKAIFWPLNNIFSYRFEKNNDEVRGVVFFYNPVVLWGALAVVVLTLTGWVRKRPVEPEKLFLVGLFLSFWLPWILSPRIVYPYYWLAAIPFGTVLFSKFLWDKNKKGSQVVLGFKIAALLLFALYYPILSNMPVKITYFRILTGTIGFD